LVTETELAPDVRTTEPGDHERLSHYYDKRVYSLVDAMLAGTPITALCGKVWVPTRDPEKFPVCPECQAIVDARSVD
jgi:hypothetical protein